MGVVRIVNGATENDHAFSIELDIVKLNEAGERLMIEGHIEELIEILGNQYIAYQKRVSKWLPKLH